MAQVLWAKGVQTDDLMLRLTVGSDYLVDLEIIASDCVASAAHARMLHAAGILNEQDTKALLAELRAAREAALALELEIPVELEDAHTFLENRLVEKLGEAGRRIHAGRSRNDQSLVATRLLVRETLLAWLGETQKFASLLVKRARELQNVAMPGYTHTQPAMPSSFGIWLHAFAEAALGLLREGLFWLEELNSNPLGAAAGFGSSIKLDRELTARLLGFSRVQRNPLDCMNSRGKAEEAALRWAMNAASLFEKLACDAVLYCSREFSLIKLPAELTTGSSIMPQKRNPDIAELLRARAAKIRAAALEEMLLTAKLPSSYHRDFQYTKEPFVRARPEMDAMFEMARLIVERFQPNHERLQAVMYDDLYATYAAYDLVEQGMPFRDAYRAVAQKVNEGKLTKERFVQHQEKIFAQSARDITAAEEELKVLSRNVDERSAFFAKIAVAAFEF